MKTPVLVCCPLCGDPFEIDRHTEVLVCGCTRSEEFRRCSAVDFLEEKTLSDEDLLLLAERYGVLDGRPRSVAEVARARGVRRTTVRRLEGLALRKWRQACARARVA